MAAFALLAASVLAWPVNAWASPGRVAGANGPLVTTSTVATTPTRPGVGAATVGAPAMTTAPTTTGPGAGDSSVSDKGTRTGPDHLRFPDEAVSPVAIKVPPGERLIDGQQVISIGAPWDASSLNASTSQRVPFALGALILVFVLVQWLIDRRDPKFVEAPARRHEDSIGFE